MARCKYCNKKLSKGELTNGACCRCMYVKLPLVRKFLKICKQIKEGVIPNDR